MASNQSETTPELKDSYQRLWGLEKEERQLRARLREIAVLRRQINARCDELEAVSGK